MGNVWLNKSVSGIANTHSLFYRIKVLTERCCWEQEYNKWEFTALDFLECYEN